MIDAIKAFSGVPVGRYQPSKTQIPKPKQHHKQLKDAPIAEQYEAYREKEEVLNEFCERVSAETMYEDIFSDLSMVVPIVCIDANKEKHMLPMSIASAVAQVREGKRNDMCITGATFYKTHLSKAMGKDLYTLIVDLDNVYSGPLERMFKGGWCDVNGKKYPKPTYIVNSGHGLHLYFVLKRPLPLFNYQKSRIATLNEQLQKRQAFMCTYAREDLRWWGQTFRMAGGCGKNGWENTCYRFGKKWDAKKLAEELELDIKLDYRDGRKKNKPSQPKKIKNDGQNEREGYYLNKRVYETSVDRCRNEVFEGHRYRSCCALAILAWKCKIPFHQLEEDLYSLVPAYNKQKDVRTPFRKEEVASALLMYNKAAIQTPRKVSEEYLGWEFVGARRNIDKTPLNKVIKKGPHAGKPSKVPGRYQEDHLKLARAIRDIEHPDGSWRDGNGRPDKRKQVEEWRAAHPKGTKVECIRDTGLSKPTVYKWWDPIKADKPAEVKSKPTVEESPEEEIKEGQTRWTLEGDTEVYKSGKWVKEKLRGETRDDALRRLARRKDFTPETRETLLWAIQAQSNGPFMPTRDMLEDEKYLGDDSWRELQERDQKRLDILEGILTRKNVSKFDKQALEWCIENIYKYADTVQDNRGY